MRVHDKPPGRAGQRAVRPEQRGFTLIEVVVVVAIVGMIALISIPNLQRIRVKAKGTSALISAAGAFELARAESTKRHSPIGVFVDYTVEPPYITVWEDWDPDNQTDTPFDTSNGNGVLDGSELRIDGRPISRTLQPTSAPSGDPDIQTDVCTVTYKSDGSLNGGDGAAYFKDHSGNYFRIRVVPTSGSARIEGWLPDSYQWSSRKEDWPWKY